MRILFITSNRIGDAVLSTGLLSNLHMQYPEAKFTVATGPVAAPLFDGLPGLERIILMPKKKYGRHWLSLWCQTVRQKWDQVVDLRRSAIGYCLVSKKRSILPKAKPNQHQIELLAELLDKPSPLPAPILWTTPANEKEAARIMAARRGPFLAIGPTANWAGKTWPAENFADLIKKLTSDNGFLCGATVLVFGAPDERLQTEPVLRAIPPAKRIDLVGKVDLLTATACMKRADLYIGNDSGLMHMAAACKIPTLGLFGPSREELYAPWGKHARWIRTPESFDELMATEGYDHRTIGSLLTNLTVDRVAHAAHTLWLETRNPD